MPVGPQYSSEFGKTSGSMNGLQVWPAPNAPELAVGVAQPERGLAFVDAGAEQLELEGGLQVAERVGVDDSHAETALAHAGERAVVCPNWSSNDGSLVTRIVSNQFGIDLLEVVADVEHREAVDLEGRLGLWLGLRRAARRIAGARLGLLRARAREPADEQRRSSRGRPNRGSGSTESFAYRACRLFFCSERRHCACAFSQARTRRRPSSKIRS